MRSNFGKFSYLWFLEFQKRGAPHVHLLTNIVCAGDGDRDYNARAWVDSIDCGVGQERKVYLVHKHHKCWELVRSENGARHYVTKYALKTEQKLVPKKYSNVGRWWGSSRDVKVGEPLEKVEVTEFELRRALRQAKHPAATYVFLPSVLFGLNVALTPKRNIDKIVTE